MGFVTILSSQYFATKGWTNPGQERYHCKADQCKYMEASVGRLHDANSGMQVKMMAVIIDCMILLFWWLRGEKNQQE